MKYTAYYKGKYLNQAATLASLQKKINAFIDGLSKPVPCDFRIYAKDDRLSLDGNLKVTNYSWVA